jgi:two-component system, chemotaxis family, chemotaxis protein CheY
MSKRILIADDTAYMRAIIREILVYVGLVVVAEAENGEEALALYRQEQPDLVIMNIVMPKMTGLQALQHIKAWDPKAKVLICSAMGQAPTVFSAIQAGAADFLIKPFDGKRLLDSVCKVLHLKFIQPVE